MAKSKKETNKRIDEWQKINIKRVVVKLNRNTDADIIRTLEEKASVQGYIKRLIREDMNMK